MTKIVGLSILLLAVWLAADADATGCRVVNRNAVVHHNVHHNVAQVVLLAQYPQYSIGYAPQVDEEVLRLRQDNAILKQNNSILELQITIGRLQGEIQQMKSGNVGKQFLPQKGFEDAPPPKKASLSAKNCASCHDAAVAEVKAKGYVFFTGGELTATPEQRNRMGAAVLENRMPPKNGPKLEDAEVPDVLLEIMKAPAVRAKT